MSVMLNRRWQLHRGGSLGLCSPSANTPHCLNSHLLHCCFENVNSILLVEISVLKSLNVININWFSYSSEIRNCGVSVQYHTGKPTKHCNNSYLYCLKCLQCKYQLVLNLMFLPSHHFLLPVHRSQEENPLMHCLCSTLFHLILKS